MSKKLYIIPFEKYNIQLFKVLKKELNESPMTYYITLNKTFSKVKSALDDIKADLDCFYFLDSITPSLFDPRNMRDVEFLNYPIDLKKLSNRILTSVKSKKIDLVIFDSFSSLLASESNEDIISFSKDFFAILDSMGVNLILFALKEDINKPAIRKIRLMVDEVLMIDGEDVI